MKGVRAGNMKKINCIWNKIEMTLNCITLWTVLLDDARLYGCEVKSKVYDSGHVTCAEEYFCLFGTDSSKCRTIIWIVLSLKTRVVMQNISTPLRVKPSHTHTHTHWVTNDKPVKVDLISVLF